MYAILKMAKMYYKFIRESGTLNNPFFIQPLRNYRAFQCLIISTVYGVILYM